MSSYWCAVRSLQHCCFHVERPIPYETAPSIEYSVFQKCYPRFPVVNGIHILPRHMDMWLDLTVSAVAAAAVAVNVDPVSCPVAIHVSLAAFDPRAFARLARL